MIFTVSTQRSSTISLPQMKERLTNRLPDTKPTARKWQIDPNGRHAVTHYRVIERLKQNFSLVECELETGTDTPDPCAYGKHQSPIAWG